MKQILAVPLPILQMRNLRHGDGSKRAWAHTAGKWRAGTWSRQSGPGVHVLSQLLGGLPLSCLRTLYLPCQVSAQDSPSLDGQLLWPWRDETPRAHHTVEYLLKDSAMPTRGTGSTRNKIPQTSESEKALNGIGSSDLPTIQSFTERCSRVCILPVHLHMTWQSGSFACRWTEICLHAHQATQSCSDSSYRYWIETRALQILKTTLLWQVKRPLLPGKLSFQSTMDISLRNLLWSTRALPRIPMPSVDWAPHHGWWTLI